MKKIVFLLAIALVVYKWDTVKEFVDPPPDYSAYQIEPVVLYATNSCSYCAKTREFFHTNNIMYYEYDIERDSQGKAQFNQLGQRGVPVVLINGKLVAGYNPKRMSELLEL